MNKFHTQLQTAAVLILRSVFNGKIIAVLSRISFRELSPLRRRKTPHVRSVRRLVMRNSYDLIFGRKLEMHKTPEPSPSQPDLFKHSWEKVGGWVVLKKKKLCQGLGALAADSAGKHDGDALGVDGAQVGVLEVADEAVLWGAFPPVDLRALCFCTCH
jgi:hypothetical protein